MHGEAVQSCWCTMVIYMLLLGDQPNFSFHTVPFLEISKVFIWLLFVLRFALSPEWTCFSCVSKQSSFTQKQTKKHACILVVWIFLWNTTNQQTYCGLCFVVRQAYVFMYLLNGWYYCTMICCLLKHGLHNSFYLLFTVTNGIFVW